MAAIYSPSGSPTPSQILPYQHVNFSIFEITSQETFISSSQPGMIAKSPDGGLMITCDSVRLGLSGQGAETLKRTSRVQQTVICGAQIVKHRDYSFSENRLIVLEKTENQDRIPHIRSFIISPLGNQTLLR